MNQEIEILCKEYKESFFQNIDGGVLASGILESASTGSGIKNNDPLDTAILYSREKLICLGSFTQNGVRANCIDLDKNILQKNQNLINGVIINSGNANALTGKEGKKANVEILKALKKEFGKEKEFLILSTGVIGKVLEKEKIIKNISHLKNNLSKKDENFKKAILTTDQFPKEAAVRFKIDNNEYIIGGTAKGAGMIHPDMATMLAFFSTNLKIPRELGEEVLKETIDSTFNAISVDGDTSTNDTVLFFFKEGGKIPASHVELFKKAFKFISCKLSAMIVYDGEKSSKLIKLTVKNAKSIERAKNIAKNISTSILVKCAFAGNSPNWGRIIAAAGRNRTEINIEKLILTINGEMVFENGEPSKKINLNSIHEDMKIKRVIEVVLNLNEGEKSYTSFFSDLTPEYVKFNMEFS